MKDHAASPGERATQSRYNLMQLAADLDDVISLGAGDPDLDTPPRIIEAAFREMARGEHFSPIRGLERLRSALAARYRQKKQLDFDPETEILVTNGAQEALFLSVMALVNPGATVLVPDPRYSSYDQAIEAAGGKIVSLTTGRNGRFELDPDELRRRSGEAEILILVNPSNPTGALIAPDEVREIASIARTARLPVIYDEVYEGLIFDEAPVLSMVQCEGMREQTITLSSFSKTYAMTGFRVGYLLGPPVFIEAAVRLKGIISGPCPLLSQYAGLAALTEGDEAARDILNTFAGRRRVMMEGLDSLEIPYGHPAGGFFIWADISRFGLPAEELCRRLLLDTRVLVFPGSAFGKKWKDYVRISILQTEERIAEAVERLHRFSLESQKESS